MRKPSADYWTERFNLLEQNLHNQGVAYFHRVGRSYDGAIASLEKELAGWYSRYATENGITYAEAKKQLSKGELAAFKMDVEEYIEKGRSLDPAWRKQLEQASVRVHVSRLEAMKIRMQQNAELLAGETRDALDDMAHKVYSEKYYHTLYEIQKGVGVGFDCAELSDKKIKAAIGKTWTADGKHFSSRIWEDKARLVNELDTAFTQGVIRGTAPKKVIAEISKRMSVKKSNVARLILTENKALQSRAELDGYKELGINVYEIVATLDTRTSPTCREMDGKQFKRSEFEPGITAPPFHPYCRTCTVPYDEDVAAIFGEGEQRAARDKEGKYYRIPAKIKYGEWYEAFINGGDKTAFPLVPITAVTKALVDEPWIQKIREIAAMPNKTEVEIKQAGALFIDNMDFKFKALEDEYAEVMKVYEHLVNEKSNVTNELFSLEKALNDVTKEVDIFDMLNGADEVAPLPGKEDEFKELQKKISELIRKRDEIILKIKEVGRKRLSLIEAETKAKQESIKDTLERIGIKTGIRDKDAVYRHLGIVKTPREAQEAVLKAYEFYPSDWVDESLKAGSLKVKKVDRGYYNHGESVIAISGSGSDAYRVGVHELGHRFERVKKFMMYERQFFNRRTANEPLQWLGPGYKKTEVARFDKFLHPYMGKDYSTMYAGMYEAYELISMGFEYAATDVNKLLKDRDYAEFILGLLCAG